MLFALDIGNLLCVVPWRVSVIDASIVQAKEEGEAFIHSALGKIGNFAAAKKKKEKRKRRVGSTKRGYFKKGQRGISSTRLDQHLIVHIMLTENCDTFINNISSLTEFINH